jgi:hypothetical protein
LGDGEEVEEEGEEDGDERDVIGDQDEMVT